MANSQSNAYKNQRRAIAKSLSREAAFITEYVRCKYNDIYREAGMLYNEINNEYPRKPDLRKTLEFRQWKNNVAKGNGERPVYIPREKRYTCKRTTYRDIKLEDTETAPETPSLPNQTASCTNGRIMCLNIPLMDIPNNNSSQESVIQEGHQYVIEEGDQTVSEEGDQTADPSVIDQIPPPSVEPAFDQVMDPSVLDQLSPETFEKIIRDLQQDPNLKELMDDVVNTINTEEELVGLEIDLPEPDERLQEELELW